MSVRAHIPPRRLPPLRRPGFSLVELVIVVVILGIIAAIAVPRMDGRAQRTRAASLISTERTLQEAIERYRAEHGGRTPAHAANGTVDTSGPRFWQRLTSATNHDGGAGPHFGPYLRTLAPNPVNRLDGVRINGAPAGAGTHGWRFDVALAIIQADHAVEGGGAPSRELVDIVGEIDRSAAAIDN